MLIDIRTLFIAPVFEPDLRLVYLILFDQIRYELNRNDYMTLISVLIHPNFMIRYNYCPTTFLLRLKCLLLFHWVILNFSYLIFFFFLTLSHINFNFCYLIFKENILEYLNNGNCHRN